MFFKVVTDFLPKQIFNRLLKIVESEQFEWQWSNSSAYDSKRHYDNNFMLNKMIYNTAKLDTGFREDKKYSQLFYLIKDFQDYIKPSRDLIRMKLNLYTNQGKNIKHLKHCDITSRPSGRIDDRMMTSILNFHTCNGSTVIELGDGKTEEVKSKANQLIMFDNTWHHGITQSDTPRRIVLNINVLK